MPTGYDPYKLATDLLMGGSLTTGPTGLSGVQGAGMNGLGGLPYAPNIPLRAPAPLPIPPGVQAPGLGSLPYSPPSALQRLAGLGSAASSAASSRASSLVPELAPGASRFATNLPQGALAKAGALTRAGGYGLAAGTVGSSLIDATDIGGQNSNLEQGLQGFAQGAGAGAAIGSVVPGIGTGLGALLGGAGGGTIAILANVFGGQEDERDDTPSGQEILARAINTARIDPAIADQIVTTYETQMALLEGLEGEELEAAEAQILDATGQMVLQAIGQQPAQQFDSTNALALQAMAAQTFAPLADQINQSTALYADAMEGVIPNLPADYQGPARAMLANEQATGNKLAAAYMAQAQVIPTVNRLTQYQQDYNGLANQLFQQALQQQINPPQQQVDLASLGL